MRVDPHEGVDPDPQVLQGSEKRGVLRPGGIDAALRSLRQTGDVAERRRRRRRELPRVHLWRLSPQGSPGEQEDQDSGDGELSHSAHSRGLDRAVPRNDDC